VSLGPGAQTPGLCWMYDPYFISLDADRSCSLSEPELGILISGHLENMLQGTICSNPDGCPSRQEIQEITAAFINNIDADESGDISPKEYQIYTVTQLIFEIICAIFGCEMEPDPEIEEYNRKSLSCAINPEEPGCPPPDPFTSKRDKQADQTVIFSN
jgi:hypothetical protein